MGRPIGGEVHWGEVYWWGGPLMGRSIGEESNPLISQIAQNRCPMIREYFPTPAVAATFFVDAAGHSPRTRRKMMRVHLGSVGRAGSLPPERH